MITETKTVYTYHPCSRKQAHYVSFHPESLAYTEGFTTADCSLEMYVYINTSGTILVNLFWNRTAQLSYHYQFQIVPRFPSGNFDIYPIPFGEESLNYIELKTLYIGYIQPLLMRVNAYNAAISRLSQLN